MKIFAQIIGGSTLDSSPSVLLFFDNKRYLFNCGEGTQRFCTEYKVRLTKIGTIFLTRLAWENIGGLPGMLLTVSDIGTTQLSICGPKNTAAFIEALRYFVARSDLSLQVSEFVNSEDDEYKDELLRVVPIVITSNEQEKQSDLMDISSTANERENTLQTSSDKRLASVVEPVPNATRPTYNIQLKMPSHPKKRKQHEDPSAIMEEDEASTSETSPKPAAITPFTTPSNIPPQIQNSFPFAFSSSLLPFLHKKRKPLHKHIPDTQPARVVVCYACHMPDVPGKFDANLANELGVPPGPLRGKLTRGETVVTASGRVVKPSDVIKPPTPGQVLIVVHCPDETFIDSLVSHPRFQNYMGQNSQATVAMILHIAPHTVVSNPKYTSWMNSFAPHVQHVVASEHYSGQPIIFRAVAANLVKLNSIHSGIFAKPAYSTETMKMPQDVPANTHVAAPLMKLHLSPPAQIRVDSSDVLPEFSENEILAELYENGANSELLQRIKALKENLHSTQPHQMDIEDKGFHVTFLGTGAAIPSKYRNVSSTYIFIEGKGGVLLDAGEGTFGQLFRRYGDEFPQILSSLKAIFISHMHADHHLGLIKVLTRRHAMCPHAEPIVVVGPSQLSYWLSEYSQIEPLAYRFIDAHDVMNSPDSPNITETFMKSLGIQRLNYVPVIHCQDAYAVVITHENGWKLVFSGDTRPCKELIEAGSNCTLLIHEATFEDSMHEEAAEKKHSTTTEAIKSALAMNAQFLMMNHFSQRYPKVPTFNEEFIEKAGIAFDLMTVKTSDFDILPKFLPVLREMFKEDEDSKDDDNESNAASSVKQQKSQKPNKKKKVGETM